MANFAFDLDGTMTEDPEVFKLIAFLLRKRGHQVHIVTMRYASEGIEITKEWSRYVDGIHFTKRLAKKPHMEALGIDIHIWMDDNPKAIDLDAAEIWGSVSEEGAVIVEDHGTPKLPPVTREDVEAFFVKPIKIKSNHYADIKCAALNNPACAKILKRIELSPGIEIVPNDFVGFTSDLSVYFMYPEEMNVFALDKDTLLKREQYEALSDEDKIAKLTASTAERVEQAHASAMSDIQIALDSYTKGKL